MITPNEGPVDRILRVIVGIALLGGSYLFATGLLQTVLFILGAALILTGAIGFCGLYALFGINTCPIKKTKK
jgi:hypothetical protein